MKYQKVISLVDDTANQPSKFRTRNWTEDDCNNNDAFIPVKGTITVRSCK